MRIGELARRADVSRDTIRFYERNDLIRSGPSADGSNSYRDYRDETVATLAMIAQAQDAGFSIADLAYFINQIGVLSDQGNLDSEAFLQTKIDEISAKIARSEEFLALLTATKDALKAAAQS